MLNIRKLLVNASSSSGLRKCKALLEELVQLLFLQLHHQVVEGGVEEIGLDLTGDLVLPLAEMSLDIKEISVRAAEESVGGEYARPHLPADVELLAAGHLLIVPGLGAGVDGGGGDGVWGLCHAGGGFGRARWGKHWVYDVRYIYFGFCS